MKLTRRLTRWGIVILCLAALLSLCACTADMDVGENTVLAEEFMDHVLADDYDAAYAMVQATVTDGDFRAYWEAMQTVAEGAKSYEMEQIGWQVQRAQGLTTRATAYQVYPDNGRIVLLRVVTREDIAGIAGIHFSDVTDFIHETDAYIPTVRIVLWVFSGLCVAFTVWMLIDCARRRIKYKVLWMILMFAGVALTVTVGQSSNLNFQMGLFCSLWSIDADPGLLAVVVEIVVPLGAILYLCLRKRLTLDGEATKATEAEVPPETAAETAPETADASATAPAEDVYQAEDEASSEPQE